MKLRLLLLPPPLKLLRPLPLPPPLKLLRLPRLPPPLKLLRPLPLLKLPSRLKPPPPRRSNLLSGSKKANLRVGFFVACDPS